MQHPGLIILAAGGSTRMGQPKQLLPWKGETLLRLACRTALATTCNPVILILGHEAGQCKNEVADLSVIPVVNDRWEQGMGQSVSCGIAQLQQQPAKPAAALLMLVDQPAVTPAFLNAMEQAWQENTGTIVATSYPEGAGVPALFPSSYFAELRSLAADQGARSVIKRHTNHLRLISPPCEFYDLDTPEAYTGHLSPSSPMT